MPLVTAIKRSFIAGLILLAPLVITLIILKILTNWAFTIVNPVVQGIGLIQYTGNSELVAQLLAAVLIVASITFLGYLAQISVGRHVFGNLGRFVNIIPLINTIYSTVRQVATALVERNTAYQSVVIVEFPRPNMYAIGLITGEAPRDIERATDTSLYNVYVPNSPNPTNGHLLFVPEDEVHHTEMSVREGMRLVVTSGIRSDHEPSESPLDPELLDV